MTRGLQFPILGFWVSVVRGGDDMRSTRPGQDAAIWQPTHRHRKGGNYRLLFDGCLEADRSDVVIYDDQDGQVWVRSKQEFYDGRFSPIS